MKNERHDEAIEKGTYLMVCSGETYFTEIVSGKIVFERMMEAIFGDDWKNNADSEQIERERDALYEPDNWNMDSDFGPIQYEEQIEDGSIKLFLITDTLHVMKR